jgi:hypothetical protein
MRMCNLTRRGSGIARGQSLVLKNDGGLRGKRLTVWRRMIEKGGLL